MAKLNVSIDTETQELSVTVNGVQIDDVRYVSLSNWSYDGTPNLHFSVDTAEQVGDVTKTMCLYASKKEACVASLKYEGLFEEAGEASNKVGHTISMAKLAENARKSKEA